MIQETAKAAHPGEDGGLQHEVEQLRGQLDNRDTLSPFTAKGTFDYVAFDEGTRATVRAAAERIHFHMQRTQQQIIEIGIELTSVKSALGHGHFGNWIAAEFGMSDQTARRFMHVAARFGKSNTVLDFTPTVLYELAAPSTSDEVVEAVLESAKSGQSVTRSSVLALKAMAEDPVGRRILKQAAKEIRAEDQRASHEERQDKLEKIAEHNPDFPTGRLHPLVLIDVARHHDAYSDETGSEKAPENHYPTIPFDQLCDFPINRFAAPDSILLFWSTAASLLDDLDIIAEWGFVAFRPRDANGKLLRGDDGKPLPPVGKGKYGSHQIWRKQRVGRQTGMGRWFRDQHEVLLVARRGNVPAPLPGTQDESVFDAPVGEHSTKPHDHVRAWINRCWPKLSKIEVFARGPAPTTGAENWVFWGNQAATEIKPIASLVGKSKSARPPKTIAALANIYLRDIVPTLEEADMFKLVLSKWIIPKLGKRSLKQAKQSDVYPKRWSRPRPAGKAFRQIEVVWCELLAFSMVLQRVIDNPSPRRGKGTFAVKHLVRRRTNELEEKSSPAADPAPAPVGRIQRTRSGLLG